MDMIWTIKQLILWQWHNKQVKRKWIFIYLFALKVKYICPLLLINIPAMEKIVIHLSTYNCVSSLFTHYGKDNTCFSKQFCWFLPNTVYKVWEAFEKDLYGTPSLAHLTLYMREKKLFPKIQPDGKYYRNKQNIGKK